MGLIERGRRLQYIWSWRLRYWWLDTRQGEYAHLAVMAVGFLVFVIQMLRMLVAATIEPPSGEPAKAVYWWIIQLIIMIVAAAISYANRPKPQNAQPTSADVPTTEDGLAAKHYFGECWVEDEFQLAHKIVGKDPIKTKGGKK